MSAEETKAALATIQKTIDEKMAKVGELEAEGKSTNEAVKALDLSLKSFTEKFSQLQAELTDLAQKGLAPMPAEVIQGVGAQVVASESFQKFVKNDSTKASIQIKNTILNSGGAAPLPDQLGGVVAGAFQPLDIIGTVTPGQTDEASIVFSKESNWVGGAAIQVEGDAKAESTLTFATKTENVRTIATHISASKQALRNSAYMASYIDMRLSHDVRLETENQIVNGDGIGENMSGWLASGNNTVISPLLTTDIFGLANKLKTAVKLNKEVPAFFYIHPSDWSKAETTRVGTGDARFVGANSAITYVNGGLTPLLWTIPVVESETVPEGTLICKSRMADQYITEDSLTVTVSDSHGDNFTKNLVTILAETAGVEVVYTARGICTGLITGITAPV